MALIPNNTPTQLSADDIEARFRVAQDGTPTAAQLSYQKGLAEEFTDLADRINRDVADSRAKGLAITRLQEALMWAGKAIFAEAGEK